MKQIAYVKRPFIWSFLVLLFCLTLPVNASEKSPQEIDLTKNNQVKTLKELVQEIESQSAYRFSYVKGLIDNVAVQVGKTKKDIDGILQEALSGTGLSYVIKAKDIVLMKTTPQPKAQGDNTSKIVKGVVVDAENNEPIIGAQIWLKETPEGTVTNIDGEFQLRVKGGVGVLVISYIGYKSQEVVIKGNQPILCKLQPDTKVLDEVVVVGYGTQKKESVVGSIASVKVDELKAPVSKLSNNLGGQLSGVITLQKNNEPGASTEFWIRGISTFGANKKPLVLVDGIERDMDLVNPEDIQSFSVLKDAAATAIYGVRGANGVILITTRTGEEGKPKISFRAEAGMLGPTKRPKMVNSSQFAEMYNEAYRSSGEGKNFYDETALSKYASGEDPDLYPDVDWLDELYKDYAFSQRINLGVSGGGNIAKYYISGAFYNEGGIFKTDSMNEYDTSTYFRRYNFRSNVDVKLHRTTTLNVNLSSVFEKLNGSGSNSDTAGAGAGTIWKYAYICAPNAFPVRFSDGKFSGPSTNEGHNPYNLLTQSGYYERFWNNAQSLIGLTQDFSELITPGLTANVKLSFDAQNYNWIRRKKQVQTFTASKRDEEGNIIYTEGNVGQDNLDYSKGNTGYTTTYIEASVNYNRTFGKHSVGALFLYNQKQKNKTGVDKAEDALPYRHQGIAGRVTYAYNDRYFIEGNFGYNGSENFSPGHRFGFFPSVAAGWLVSNEKFWEPISHVIDMLKIKGSYGEVGNDQIGGNRRFIYNATVIDSGSYDFGKTAHTEKGLRVGDWANPNVGWERAKKMNAGVEISFFNALKIQADYFSEKREGIFLERASLPLYIGVSTKPYVNVGKMKNHGFDTSLEYNQRVGQVRLSGKANFTYAHNTIIDNDQPDWKYPYLNRRGQMLWQQYGLVAAGLFESQADIDSWPTQTFGEVKPGDIKYIDINGDGKIDTNDEKPIGWAAVPEIVYGFGLSAAWKGLDCSVFFQGAGHVTLQQSGSAIQAFSARNMMESGVYEDIYYNHWSEDNPNPNAKYPRLSIGSNKNNFRNSTFWQKDMSYLRLKTVEIGYNFPSKWIDPIHISGLRIYLSGVNLLTFSKFKLWDPEVLEGQGANYPANRIFNFGININL